MKGDIHYIYTIQYTVCTVRYTQANSTLTLNRYTKILLFSLFLCMNKFYHFLSTEG